MKQKISPYLELSMLFYLNTNKLFLKVPESGSTLKYLTTHISPYGVGVMVGVAVLLCVGVPDR